MSDRTVYHVVPDSEYEGWSVKLENADQASSRHDTKAEALDRARELAKARTPSQVYVHRQDGTIQDEYTYDDDAQS